MQYHRRSVEFRLLVRRSQRETAYRTRQDAWTAARLLDIYSAVAAPLTDPAARKTYLRTLEERYNALIALLEPPPSGEDAPSRGAANSGSGDADKVAYLDALSGVGPFRSLDHLLAAMRGLHKTVEELRGDHA